MLRVSDRWRLAAPAILLPLVLISSWICYRALAARGRAVAEADAAKYIAVTFAPVEPATSASETIASASEFRDVAMLHGRLYLCAPDALYGYDSSGALVETYRAGRELPPGELVAVGQSGGNLYIATRGAGVLAFDGAHFRRLLPADSHLRNFTAIAGLSDGRTLLGTGDRGVLVWDGKTLRDFLPALKSDHITALAYAGSDLWIGTLANGAWRLHAGQLDHVLADLPDPHVLSIALAEGAAYIGTPVGVLEFRDGKKTRALAEGYFARSLEADADTLAVGTEDEGIVTVPLAPALRPGQAAAAQEFKTSVERIFRLDGVRYALAGSLYKADAAGTKWTRVLEPARGTLSDRNVAALALAHDGRLWVGYFDRGLDVAAGSLDEVRHFEDETLFCVNRIVEEPGGARTAVATANGLALFDASLTLRQVMGRKDGLLADHITDIVFRNGGTVVATLAGLSISGAGGIRNLYVLQGLVNNHVYALAAAGDRIAAGTLGGLSLLGNDAVEANYTTANSGLRHNWISALARIGDDWFAGTYGAGIMRLDASGRCSEFSDLKRGLEVNQNTMAQTADSLYVGSLGDGLWVYSKATARWHNVAAGLPSLNVTAIATGNGYVYAGTDNGLVRFREEAVR